MWKYRQKLTILLLIVSKSFVIALPESDIRAGEEEGALFVRGRVNTSDEVADLSDAVYIFGFVFLGNTAPTCLDAADVNDDGELDLSDGVALLNYVFTGGPPPPPPSPEDACPGADPTADGLDCAAGIEPGAHAPTAEIYAVIANAPGVRERSRTRLPPGGSPGVYVVEEGTSFTVLVEAVSNPDTVAGFTLTDPGNPLQGNPATLSVTANLPLGNPAVNGVAAGENLAPWFLQDLDLWHDATYRIDQVGLRISSDGPLAPAAGEYTFTVRVTDQGCATSLPVSFTLEVVPSQAPDLFAWVETGMDPTGVAAAHNAGSGNARIDEQGFLLVVEGLPNSTAGVTPDPSTLQVIADPPLGSGADVTSQFVADPLNPARFSWRIEPGVNFPGMGNTQFTLQLGTAPATSVTTRRFVLERELSYPNDIQPIWNMNCGGCHEEPTPARGLELVKVGEDPEILWLNFVNIVAAEPQFFSIAIRIVQPYFPERSYLYHKVAGTHLDPEVAGSGVRMPADSLTGLDEETLHRIESWIVQGAQKS